MKEYNRTTKRWEDVSKNTSKGTLKKRETCRGGKAHDFQLVLPRYLTPVGYPTLEAIEEYYRLEDERLAYMSEYRAKVNILLGTKERRAWSERGTKYLECTVCGKQDYITPEEK